MPGEPPVRVGQVLRLAEEDYRFGVGPLVLRVTGLLHIQELTDGPWLYLRGTTIRWDGGDGEARQVLVRLAALRVAPGWTDLKEKTMDRTEMAVRIMAGTGDVRSTRVDDEGLCRYVCCGTPAGARPAPHDMVECLAKSLVYSGDDRETKVGADLYAWMEQRTYERG